MCIIFCNKLSNISVSLLNKLICVAAVLYDIADCYARKTNRSLCNLCAMCAIIHNAFLALNNDTEMRRLSSGVGEVIIAKTNLYKVQSAA